MRTRTLTQGLAAAGGLLVTGATFLAWGTGGGSPASSALPRRIYTYQPELLRNESAWHAFPVIAGLLVVAAALSLGVHFLRPGNPLQQTILSSGEAAFVLILALACWISPPGGHAGPGQPLATAGALFLMWAAALTQNGPLRDWRGPLRRRGR